MLQTDFDLSRDGIQEKKKRKRERGAAWRAKGQDLVGVGFYARTTPRYRGWRRKHRSRSNPYTTAHTYTLYIYTRIRASTRERSRSRSFGGENVLYKGGWSLMGLRLYVKAFRGFSCRSTNSRRRSFVPRRPEFFHVSSSLRLSCSDRRTKY